MAKHLLTSCPNGKQNATTFDEFIDITHRCVSRLYKLIEISNLFRATVSTYLMDLS